MKRSLTLIVVFGIIILSFYYFNKNDSEVVSESVVIEKKMTG